MSKLIKHPIYLILTILLSASLWAQNPVSATDTEFISRGDFDGDGGQDVVILDRVTGQFRVGYKDVGGLVYSDVRASGVENVSAMAVGRLLNTSRDAIAVTSPEANRVYIIAADNRTQPSIPVSVSIDAIGPNSLVAIDVGGAGNTLEDDLLVGSLWNDLPNNARLNIVRSSGGSFSDIGFQNYNVTELGNRYAPKTGTTAFAFFMERGAVDDHLVAYDTSAGPPSGSPLLSLSSLPMGSNYSLGYFAASGLATVLVWTTGDTQFTAYPINEPSPGNFAIGSPTVHVLGDTIEQISPAPNSGSTDKLIVLQASGSYAQLFDFDGVAAPSSIDTFAPSVADTAFSGIAVTDDGRFSLTSNDGNNSFSALADNYSDSGSGYGLDSSTGLPAIFSGAAPTTVLLFENEPFVEAEPNLLRALNAGHWSTSVNFSGGNVNVTTETYGGTTSGLGNPTTLNMGAALPDENFALPSQYRNDVAIAGFTRAVGTLGLGLKADPDSGTYNKTVEAQLTATDPSATIYYRIGSTGSWQVYSPPLYIFTDTDLYAYARQGAATSPVAVRNFRFFDNSGNLDSDGDGVPDYVEIANGLHPVDSGNDSDGDGFSDLEELVLGSDPTDDASTPSGWTPSSTSPRPTLEQQTAFNITLTPQPLDGTTGSTTNASNDETMYAHDPQGNELSRADIGAPPAKTANMALWLDAGTTSASKTKGTSVTRIEDLTGQHVLQSVGSAPTVAKTAERNTWRFEANTRLKTTESLSLTDYTLFAVFKESSQSTSATLASGALSLTREAGQQWGVRGENGKRHIAAPFPAGETHILGISRQRGRTILTRDGVVVNTAVSLPGIRTGSLELGGFEGELAELILYDGQVSADQMRQTQNYLMSRYQKRAPLAYLNNINTESPILVVGTAPHYNIATLNTDTLIGREMMGAVSRPIQSPVAVTYSYGGGTIAAESANWEAAAAAAYSGLTRTTLTENLNMEDTLTLLLLEQKVGDVLFARGVIESNLVTLTPQRPNDTNRTLLSEDQLALVENRHPGVDNGFKYSDMITQIETELGSTDPNIVALVNILETVYDISSEHHNTPPQQFRLPMDVLRDFIGTGTMDTFYITQAGFTQTQLTNALAGAHAIIGGLSGRTVTTYEMYITETSFSTPCTTLESVGVPYSLFDDKGEPYSLLSAGGLTLVPGLRFNVTAYTDSSATPCGSEAVLEVIDVALIGIVYPDSKRKHDDPFDDNNEEETAADKEAFFLTRSDRKSTQPKADVTEPDTPAEPVYVTRLEVLGEEGIDAIGDWWIEDTAMVGEEGRGSIHYVMEPELADLYRLEIEVAGDQDESQPYNLRVWMDDAYLGRHTVEASYEQTALLHLNAPFLDAREHKVRILWDDLPGVDPVSIVALRLQERLGPDSDENGLKDWVEDHLYNHNYVDVAPMASQVSPAVLEGTADFPSNVRINDTTPAQAALEGRWFARLPLSDTQPTPVSVTLANGAVREHGLIEWMPTNILEGGEIILRAGDSLRLTAGDGSGKGRFQIRSGKEVLRANGTQTLNWTFEKPGKHTISGAHVSAAGKVTKGSMTVIVAPAQLPDAALWAGNARKWDLHKLPNEVVLEADDAVSLTEIAYLPKGGRRTELGLDQAESYHVVARLGSGGPILDAATINGFSVHTANETYVRRVAKHDDGSETIAIGLVASPLPHDAELRLTVIVGGVTFEDGTISKTMRAADFDELGRAEVRFNRAADAKTAVCHITEAYQRYVYIGTVAQLREEK